MIRVCISASISRESQNECDVTRVCVCVFLSSKIGEFWLICEVSSAAACVRSCFGSPPLPCHVASSRETQSLSLPLVWFLEKSVILPSRAGYKYTSCACCGARACCCFSSARESAERFLATTRGDLSSDLDKIHEIQMYERVVARSLSLRDFLFNRNHISVPFRNS